MSRKDRKPGPHAERSRARKRALQALYQWQITGQDSGDIYLQFVEEQDMGKVDVEYFKTLLTGVIRDVDDLDEALAAHADREIERIDLMERALLRLGAYELRQHIETPYKVAINEMVNLAGEFGTEQSPTYVNAVLDRCAQDWRRVEVEAASRAG